MADLPKKRDLTKRSRFFPQILCRANPFRFSGDLRDFFENLYFIQVRIYFIIAMRRIICYNQTIGTLLKGPHYGKDV